MATRRGRLADAGNASRLTCMFKLAMAQMHVDGGDLDANLSRAQQRIAEAAGQGAKVVLLPEVSDCGWIHARARELADRIPGGHACMTLANAAKEHGVYVCAGLTEREGERVYNAAVLINPRGQVIQHHRKLNEVTFGHATYDQGDRLGVVQTELGTIGLMICADGFCAGQVIGRTLGYMGAQVVLMPSAWAVPPDHDNVKEPYGELWRDNLGPVARDFEMWIASVSNVGEYIRPGRDVPHPCIGNSLVFDANGGEVLTGPYGQEADVLLYVDVEPRPRPARACGWPEYWKGRGQKVNA